MRPEGGRDRCGQLSAAQKPVFAGRSSVHCLNIGEEKILGCPPGVGMNSCTKHNPGKGENLVVFYNYFKIAKIMRKKIQFAIDKWRKYEYIVYMLFRGIHISVP